MPTTGGTKSAGSPYQLQLFSNLPLYTTQLVCETRFPFCERIQVSAPADVVPILQEYFRLKDREEMILVLLDTANTIENTCECYIRPPELCLLGPFVEPEQKRALTTTETAYHKEYRRKQPENAGFRAF